MVSPIVPEVSSRVTPSAAVSSVTLYSGAAPSNGSPMPLSLLYGGRPPLMLMSLQLPQFADNDFIPSSIQSILVATCIDLDALASEVSGSSFGYSPVSIGEKGGMSSSCSGTSSEDEQADTSPVLSRFQPWNRPTYCHFVLESPSHYETPTMPIAISALIDSVAGMSQMSALSFVQLSPNRVREDCTSKTPDVFPDYHFVYTSWRLHQLRHQFPDVSRRL